MLSSRAEGGEGGVIRREPSIAYVLVSTRDAAANAHVYLALKRTPCVAEVVGLFSEWDLIVKVVAATVEVVQDAIAYLRAVDGVVGTQTLRVNPYLR